MVLQRIVFVLLTSFALLLASGCTVNARKDWFSDLLCGVVESAISDNRDDDAGGYREPGISDKESRRRYEQKRLNEFDSKRISKERKAQQERDAALLKNWLQRKEMNDHFSRDRSKDLF